MWNCVYFDLIWILLKLGLFPINIIILIQDNASVVLLLTFQ